MSEEEIKKYEPEIVENEHGRKPTKLALEARAVLEANRVNHE